MSAVGSRCLVDAPWTWTGRPHYGHAMIELGSEPGPVLTLSPVGARVVSLVVPVHGERREVTLGLADDTAYLADENFLGASVGRYANRIARGELPLDGVVHTLATQPAGHTLHGGPDGFDKRPWTVVEAGEAHAVLGLESPDGDQGFPGLLRVAVRYDVAADSVTVTFTATTDAATVVCLTNHTYWDLSGTGRAGAVDGHRLTVAGSRVVAVDGELLPTGELAAVDGTDRDLRVSSPVGDSALDHCFVLDDGAPQVRLESPAGDLALEVSTDQPGVQVYTGDGLKGRREVRAGIALEPEAFPDSPHHPEWPSAVLRQGEEYRHVTTWRFVTP
jgi:aldose 1-epimerase